VSLSAKNTNSGGDREVKTHDPLKNRKLDNFFDKNSDRPGKTGGLTQAPRFQKRSINGVLDEEKRDEAVFEKKQKNWTAYIDRVQMDRVFAQSEFRIKNFGQVFHSTFSFFRPPPDKVCKFFVTKRLPEMCGTLEQLISAVRIIFPHSNQGENTLLQEYSSFSYKVLNVIRHWNISRIASMIGILQNHANNVYVFDLKHLLRLIYQPIFILDAVDADEYFPFILGNLYLPVSPKDGNAEKNKVSKKTIETVTQLYREVSRKICYVMHPLLMKLTCKKWYDYSTFITEHRQEIYDFLEIKETDCVIPPEDFGDILPGADDKENTETVTVARPEEKSNEEPEV
jgi:hypothetical protein